jgi:hypothetical protein
MLQNATAAGGTQAYGPERIWSSRLNTEPTERLSATAADALTSRLTNGRMRVETDAHGAFLTHVGKRGKVRLLPYQLTPHGIEQAAAENEPWPHD